ncbi:KR domain protein [Bordetella bronchiseptica OSU553]|nr:KR domain protein [Bordetella bronchiseptica OSU553]
MRSNWPACVLLTGASGEIGRALALEYAAPGVRLILQGRRLERLDELAGLCRERGATISVAAFDIRATERLLAWLEEVNATHPPDLAIVNAGVNIDIGPDRAGERWDDVCMLMDTNLRAAQATVHGLLPAMRARGQGQIALMSSLAAWRGLPDTPSYSASKAAVKAYGEALRDWLAPQGVRVNVIMPGYVASPMCAAMPGPKPFLWPPGKAARAIRRGLAANRARISFPFPLNLGCWFLGLAHPAVSSRLLRWLGYGG